jgi:hypothetical protein
MYNVSFEETTRYGVLNLEVFGDVGGNGFQIGGGRMPPPPIWVEFIHTAKRFPGIKVALIVAVATFYFSVALRRSRRGISLWRFLIFLKLCRAGRAFCR